VPIVHVNNFSYGLLNPVLGYLMSCLGAFIGLRCVTRARAYQGLHRALWRQGRDSGPRAGSGSPIAAGSPAASFSTAK